LVGCALGVSHPRTLTDHHSLVIGIIRAFVKLYQRILEFGVSPEEGRP
jgi:hypothetical protein